MKKTTVSFKNLTFYFLIFLFSQLKSFSQSNVIYYGTFGGDSYRAEIVKAFKSGDPNPQLRFKHTRLATWQSHYEDFIDYVSDAGERWRATVHYNYVTQSLYFRHCKFDNLNDCHDDVVMNITDFSGCKWNIKFDNYTLGQLQSNSEIIKLTQTLLGCPKPPIGNATTGGGTGGNPQYTLDKSNSDWVVKFTTSARVLFHVGSGFSPGVIMDMNPGGQLVIKPGQWAQDWIYFNGNYVWSLMSDADHR